MPFVILEIGISFLGDWDSICTYLAWKNFFLWKHLKPSLDSYKGLHLWKTKYPMQSGNISWNPDVLAFFEILISTPLSEDISKYGKLKIPMDSLKNLPWKYKYPTLVTYLGNSDFLSWKFQFPHPGLKTFAVVVNFNHPWIRQKPSLGNTNTSLEIYFGNPDFLAWKF